MSAANLPSEILVYDTETGGVDTDNDRVLTCYMMRQSSEGEVLFEREWIIDPGVESGFVVPQGASDVHGMTTEWILEHGRKDVQIAIEEISQQLARAAWAGVPIVAFNQRFDFSILNAERKRNTGYSLNDVLKSGIFYDPLVHDKARDKYRKGKRTLQAICQHFGIEFNEEDAHEAKYDVVKTAELAWHHLKKDKLSIAELYKLMPGWKEEQDSSLQDYFTKSGKLNDDGTTIVIDRGWPLITSKGN